MPTFESNVPPSARPSSDKSDPGLAGEFRPRRREQWANAGNEATFDPTPIPADVKKSIDQRISEMMRQTRGPDETFFALREWISTAKRIFFSLPGLVRDIFHRSDDDEDDEADEAGETSAEAPKKQNQEKNQQRRSDGQKPQQRQQQQQQHRGRRGGRRHNRRGRGGRQQNQPRNDSSDGD